MTRAYKRGGVWYVDYVDSMGKRQRVATKVPTKAAAEKLAAEMQQRADRARKGLGVEESNPEGITLKQAADWWLRRKKLGPKSSLFYTVKKHIAASELAPLRLEFVTPARLDEFLKGREEVVGKATVNRIHMHVSGIFTQLIKTERYFGGNPAKKLQRHKEARQADRILPRWQVPVLIKNAPTEQWALTFTAAAYAGLRRGEIQNLDLVDDVDLDARVGIVRKSKTGEARRFGIHPVFAEAIKAARGRGERRIKVGWAKSAEMVRRILTRSGIALTSANACFHSLRHTWRTALDECGANPGVVASMGGWSMAGIMDRVYLHLPDERLRLETDKLTYPVKDADILKGSFGKREKA